ncbi:GNAT family N-acetyltransferase [Rhodobacteraceae bacterium RKSG542]|uniref:GNAT family N-acetyltransferase n=1 Tax=Pseudovibrio flavus TaxID=2529854 RepID=UPI0012BC4EFC|nr:GNAT family N-acetyltransferase [Pseudovibrio flavus]MTI16221.1 GNAT family N-acetyltransferase [Pseudovibrio flavus]
MIEVDGHLRLLGPADYNDAMELYAELSHHAFPLTDRARYESVLNHEGTTVWGIEVEGKIVSMATLHMLPSLGNASSHYALIENVITTKRHQNKGLGASLLRAVLAYAWDKDAYKVMLLTGKQRDALEFYQKLGFDEDEKHGLVCRKPA